MAHSGKTGVALLMVTAAFALLAAAQAFDGLLIGAIALLAIAGIGWRPQH